MEKYISKYQTGEAVDDALDNGVAAYNEVTAAKVSEGGTTYSSLADRLDNMDSNVPTALSDLSEDTTHRTVSDTEKTTWNSKLPSTTKYGSTIELSINSSTYVMSLTLKDQNGDALGTTQTIDLPLESVVVGGSYDDNTKKVILTLQNGNTVEFSVADLVAGLQSELSASNKLNPAYIDWDSTHIAVTSTDKTAWDGKQDEVLGSWTAGSATTHSTPAGTDTVLEALQKIDNNQRLDESNILSEQAKTTGMTEGGSNYITVGGIRLYISATAPTGARTGDLWIGG